MNLGTLEKFLPKSGDKTLLIDSFIVITASMLGNVFSYLFQLLAGKYLSKSDFAELASLFALSGIIGLVVMFFTNGIVKIIAEHDHTQSDYKHNVSVFFYSVLKINLITLTVIGLLLLTLSYNIALYLRLEDINVFYMFTFAVIASVLVAQVSPFLQGFQKFKALAVFTFFTSFTKFLVIGAVVIIGLRLIDVFFGLAMTTIFMAIIGMFFLRSNIDNNIKSYDKKYIKKLFNYSIGAFFTVLGINLIQNIDIILVKHYFDTHTASTYSSLSIIGKIIFYAASPIGIIMLPICAKQYTEYKNNASKHSEPKHIKTFMYSVIMTLVIAGSTTIAFASFPNLIVNLLFGDKYIDGAKFLPIYSLTIFLQTLINLFSLFFIAISKFRVAAGILIGSIIQFIGINLFHQDINVIVYVNLVSTLSVCIIYGLHFLIYDSKTKEFINY